MGNLRQGQRALGSGVPWRALQRNDHAAIYVQQRHVARGVGRRTGSSNHLREVFGDSGAAYEALRSRVTALRESDMFTVDQRAEGDTLRVVLLSKLAHLQHS